MQITTAEFNKMTAETTPLITERQACVETLKEVYSQYSEKTGLKPAELKKLAEAAYSHTVSEEASKYRNMAELFESLDGGE